MRKAQRKRGFLWVQIPRSDKEKKTGTRMCASGSHPGRHSSFAWTRGLTKAPLGLWLRCCAPPPCSNPAAIKKEPVHECVLVLFGASSDTAFFENHHSTICFLGHRIATCLYRTPMGSCIEKTVAFYIPHNLKIIKYAQRSLLPSPGANERCFFVYSERRHP